jgi:hypothetical protein
MRLIIVITATVDSNRTTGTAVKRHTIGTRARIGRILTVIIFVTNVNTLKTEVTLPTVLTVNNGPTGATRTNDPKLTMLKMHISLIMGIALISVIAPLKRTNRVTRLTGISGPERAFLTIGTILALVILVEIGVIATDRTLLLGPIIDVIVTGRPKQTSDRTGIAVGAILRNRIPDIIVTVGSQGITEEIANLGTIGQFLSTDTIAQTATMLRTIRFLIIATMLGKLITVIIPLIHKDEMIVKIVTIRKFGNIGAVGTLGQIATFPQFGTNPIPDFSRTTVTEHISLINRCHR